jgi:glycosyltransferase involved in cell wall biosynthesis
VRILHVVPTYLPARRYGGPIYAVHGLASALVARGHDVDVFTTNVDGKGTSKVPVGSPVDLDGVRVHYFPAPFKRLYWSPKMRNALLADAGRYDLVHIHSIYLYPTLAASFAASLHGVPSIISPRGMLVRDLIARKSWLLKSVWLRLVERRNFTRATAVHFTAQREWEDANEIRVPLPLPFVVPNGIDLPPLPDLPRDERTVLFLGRLSWKKGLDRLIGALPMMEAGTRLEIAGNDEEHYTPRLRELAENIGVGDRVRFLGGVHGVQKYELMRRASVFVLSSYSENFGNTVVEAMAMETPVVVTPQVGLAEDVAAAQAGLVTGLQSHEIAGSINALLRDPTLAREMGIRGRQLVESRFTWERVAEEMELAYERIRR